MKRVVILLLTLAGAAMSAGCGSDSPPDGGSSSTPSSATTSPSSSSSGVSGDTYADVEPAAGDEIALDEVTLNVPENYSVTSTSSLNAIAQGAKYGPAQAIQVVSIPVQRALSLEAFRRIFNNASGLASDPPPARDPVTVDGVKMFRQKTVVDGFEASEAFGAAGDIGGVSIEFTLPADDVSAAEQREVVESVMASVQLDLD